jgi:hypothetical protein
MNTERENVSSKDRQPSCKAKPQIGLYVFAAILVIAFLITYFFIKP